MHADASSSGHALRQILREGRLTAALALPLAAGQLSQMLIALSDTLMVGRLGVLPLAAATFANNVLYLPFIFGLGFTTAVSIRVSQARGAGDQTAARAALRHGFYLALVIGGLTMLAVWGIQPFLGLFRQEPEIVQAVPRYFLLIAASMIPALATMAVKSHADALNKPWVPLWILLGGAALNVFFNWVFIYGKLGAPRLGLDGSGVATLLARCAILAVMLWWSMRARSVRDWVPTHWFRRLEWDAIRDLVRLGIPTSVQLLAEVSAFVMATLLIGTLGPAALASHQVAMTCAAMIFMVPLGVSMALTVRMGEAWGCRADHAVALDSGERVGAGAALHRGLGAGVFVFSSRDRELVSDGSDCDRADRKSPARLCGFPSERCAAGLVGGCAPWPRRREGSRGGSDRGLLGDLDPGGLVFGFPLRARRGRRLAGDHARPHDHGADVRHARLAQDSAGWEIRNMMGLSRPARLLSLAVTAVCLLGAGATRLVASPPARNILDTLPQERGGIISRATYEKYGLESYAGTPSLRRSDRIQSNTRAQLVYYFSAKASTGGQLQKRLRSP